LPIVLHINGYICGGRILIGQKGGVDTGRVWSWDGVKEGMVMEGKKQLPA